MDENDEIIRFTIHCTMKRKWASQLIGMLHHMQHLGSIGSTRLITFYSDGDGDFRPKFECEDSTIDIAKPVRTYSSGDTVFDVD